MYSYKIDYELFTVEEVSAIVDWRCKWEKKC
jgi:hypothetical protein